MKRFATLSVVFLFVLSGTACERPDGSGGDLPEMMMYLERYFEKLYLAGEAANWELAAFYAHELEEVGKDLRDAGFVKNDVDLRPIVEERFLPAVEAVDTAIDLGPDAFRTSVAELAVTCNSCHAATGYGFVRIELPEPGRPYPSQRFAR